MHANVAFVVPRSFKSPFGPSVPFGLSIMRTWEDKLLARKILVMIKGSYIFHHVSGFRTMNVCDSTRYSVFNPGKKIEHTGNCFHGILDIKCGTAPHGLRKLWCTIRYTQFGRSYTTATRSNWRKLTCRTEKHHLGLYERDVARRSCGIPSDFVKPHRTSSDTWTNCVESHAHVMHLYALKCTLYDRQPCMRLHILGRMPIVCEPLQNTRKRVLLTYLDLAAVKIICQPCDRLSIDCESEPVEAIVRRGELAYFARKTWDS